MTLEHAAIWAGDLEALKEFYVTHFDAVANQKYRNEANQFESYFLSFDSGARLEIMNRPDISANQNDMNAQHHGLVHLAFSVSSMAAVDEKALALQAAGFKISRGPRKTGDGYYEFELFDPEQNRLEVSCEFGK